MNTLDIFGCTTSDFTPEFVPTWETCSGALFSDQTIWKGSFESTRQPANVGQTWSIRLSIFNTARSLEGMTCSNDI